MNRSTLLPISWDHLRSATVGLKFGGNCFVFRKFRLKNAQWFLK